MKKSHIDFHSPHRGLYFEIQEVLYTERSPYQEICIVQTPEFGKVMLLDGVLMLTESDEFVYHEMLCHPALISHPNPQKVLIIGGGDCGTLKRVLEHPSVTQAIQVEIDEMVTRVSKSYFPKLTSAIEDKRATLIFGDGITFLKQKGQDFDVILVDSTDPVGPAEGLFRHEFIADCYKSLSKDGILCLQSESPWITSLLPIISQVHQDLQALFPITKAYTATIQTYQAGLWMFQLAAKKYDPTTADAQQRLISRNLQCQYYNADVHQAAFMLPNFVKRLM